MKPGEPIQIIAVANGWIVQPEPLPNMCLNMQTLHVFQDMEGRYGLLEFIATHFGPQPVKEKEE